MSYLFGSKQDPTAAATRTACSKLSNNAALVVSELTREPAQGLMHVATHVQRSIPVLLNLNQQLETAAAQLQGVLEELQDAQEGIISITSPATQQDLAALAASTSNTTHRLQQQQQQQDGEAGTAASGNSSSGSSSSRLMKLFAPGTVGGAAAPSPGGA